MFAKIIACDLFNLCKASKIMEFMTKIKLLCWLSRQPFVEILIFWFTWQAISALVTSACGRGVLIVLSFVLA
jgi:hypothetical protein